MDTNIIIHHVGGRNGSIGFDFPAYFKDDFTIILYEPDEDALERIEKHSNDYYGKHYVFPYCLDSTTSHKTLNINRDPYTSSLLKQNPKFKDYYYFQNGDRHNYDYLWGEATETIIESKVKTTTLDTILANENIPAPDIYCLDTQGSEHAILKGSEKTLPNVLAIISEVEFSPLYENQSLFGDIFHYLQKFGFEFIYFNKLKEMSASPTPIVARGRGTHMFSDALFVKTIEQIRIDFPNESERKLATIKLVYFLLNAGHIGKAMNILKVTDALTIVNENKNLLDVKYIKFCNDFYLTVCAANQNINKMPTFGDMFSPSQSMQRKADEEKEPFSVKNKTIGILIKNRLKKTPFIFVVRVVRRILHKLQQVIFMWKNNKNTQIEKLLMDHGLSEVANLVKENRLNCTLGLRRNRAKNIKMA